MRVAVTGAAGLLGRNLVRVLHARGHTVVAGAHRRSPDWPDSVTRHALDVTDELSVRRFIDTARADCLIHAAAMTHVDRCETEPEVARLLNSTATERLVNAVAGSDTHIVYVSTDFVFDGIDGPYSEGDHPNPVNVYGRTKLEGEEAVRDAGSRHAIVRSASFLGIGDRDCPTFVEAMLATMMTRPPLPAAGDQRSNVTPVGYLAEAVAEIAERALGGIWHVAGREIISRYELGRHLAALYDLPESSIRQVSYATLERPARRPLNGGLSIEKAVTRLTVKPPPLAESLAAWKHELDTSGGVQQGVK